LDPDSPADVAGFRALGVVADAVAGLPDAAWRVIGGWMVRAWVEETGVGSARPTTDVDLGLLASRGEGKAERVPVRLRDAGLQPFEEPFRLRRPDGVQVDLLVPPGASRRDPPRVGDQIVFEARGSRLGFELPPEQVFVWMGKDRIGFPTVRLSAALVIKAIVLGIGRPRRAEVDAVDVARLLSVVRIDPMEAIADLRTHERKTEVKDARRQLQRLFAREEDAGARLVARETDSPTALTAVADARWLIEQLV
jgi:hypothetical protein